MKKLILEANSAPGKSSSGDSITYHTLTTDNELMRTLPEEEIKELLYKWFNNKPKEKNWIGKYNE